MSFSAALLYTILPVSTEPVKVTLRTSLCATSGAPQPGPSPERMLSTPGGSTWFITWQARSTASGASSADFTTTVLPATIAGAILSAISKSGTFQGMMAPTTPSGSRCVMVIEPGLNGTLSPFNSEPSPP